MSQLLSELIKKVTKDIRKDLLCQSFSFPYKDNFNNDNSVISLELEPYNIDFDKIIEIVREHPEAIALSIREDLILTLKLLEEVKDEIMIHRFDKFVIYRSGLNIFSITFKNNKSNRVIYLEINDYRRRLMNYLKPKDWTPYVTTLVFVTLTAIMNYFLYKNIQQQQQLGPHSS